MSIPQSSSPITIPPKIEEYKNPVIIPLKTREERIEEKRQRMAAIWGQATIDVLTRMGVYDSKLPLGELENRYTSDRFVYQQIYWIADALAQKAGYKRYNSMLGWQNPDKEI